MALSSRQSFSPYLSVRARRRSSEVLGGSFHSKTQRPEMKSGKVAPFRHSSMLIQSLAVPLLCHKVKF